MTEQVRIDDKYTYVLHQGQVTLKRHGVTWAAPIETKAWIAAANEIDFLRREVTDLSVRLDQAEHTLENLGRTWDEGYEDYV